MADENGNFDYPPMSTDLSLLRKVCNDRTREKNVAILRAHLKVGDLLTHTRCLGLVAEHRFTEWLQRGKHEWLCGRATRETALYVESGLADDISPLNVTHVNRTPILDYEFYLKLKETRK